MAKRTLYDCDVCGEEDIGETGERWPWPIRYHSLPYSHPREEQYHGCIDCTPGHSDDVLRKVKWFAVNEGYVERLYIVDTWFDRGEIDNPYIEDAIEFVETRLLPAVK